MSGRKNWLHKTSRNEAMRIDAVEITVETAAVVKTQVLAAFAAGEREFDFSGVQRVDSSALALLLSLTRESARAGVPVTCVAVPPDLKSLAELYGIADLLAEVLR